MPGGSDNVGGSSSGAIDWNKLIDPAYGGYDLYDPMQFNEFLNSYGQDVLANNPGGMDWGNILQGGATAAMGAMIGNPGMMMHGLGGLDPIRNLVSPLANFRENMTGGFGAVKDFLSNMGGDPAGEFGTSPLDTYRPPSTAYGSASNPNVAEQVTGPQITEQEARTRMSNMPVSGMTNWGDLEGFRNLGNQLGVETILPQLQNFFGNQSNWSNPTLNMLNAPGALDSYFAAMTGMPTSSPNMQSANQFLQGIGQSPVPAGEFSGVFNSVGPYDNLPWQQVSANALGGGGGEATRDSVRPGGQRAPSGTAAAGGGSGGSYPTYGGGGGYGGGSYGGYSGTMGDVPATDAMSQFVPSALQRGQAGATQAAELAGQVGAGQSPLTQQLLGQAAGGAFDPRQVTAGQPIQGTLESILSNQMTQGGLTPEFVQAQRDLILNPALEQQEGTFNRQTKGAAISGPSGLAAAQRAELEKNFANQLLAQGFQSQQNAMNLGGQLGAQQFNQGLQNAQLPAQLTSMLGNLQSSLASQGIDASQVLGQLGLGEMGQGVSGYGALADAATKMFGLGNERDLGFAGLNLQSQLGNRGMDIESQLGNRGLDVQSQLGNRGYDVQSAGQQLQHALGMANVGLERELGLGNLGLQRELGIGQLDLGRAGLSSQNMQNMFGNLLNLANLNQQNQQFTAGLGSNLWDSALGRAQNQMTSADVANISRSK